jgi:hypothetical protein
VSDDDDLHSHWTDSALLSALRLKAAGRDLSLIKKNLLWETDTSQIATRAVDLPQEERVFQCFSIPAQMSEIPVFKNLIRGFR